MTKVLIVDDDPKFRGNVSKGLEAGGFECLTAEGGQHALELLSDPSSVPDVVLLDVMMPETSGWEILEELRRRRIDVPVLFVTAKHDVQDRVKGLRQGADDYILKPFELEELVARIEAVLRRRRSLPVITVADLRMDLAHRVLERAGNRIDLSPKEFDLLLTLVQACGRVMSRTELLKQVWGIHFDPQTNVVDTAIARLRKRLDRAGKPIIRTVVGQGYKFDPEAAGE